MLEALQQPNIQYAIEKFSFKNLLISFLEHKFHDEWASLDNLALNQDYAESLAIINTLSLYPPQ